jgi:predicted metalloprotease with PDZ domain
MAGLMHRLQSLVGQDARGTLWVRTDCQSVPFSRLAAFLIPLVTAAQAFSQTTPIEIKVDATEAPRRLLHATMQFPVKPGPMSLLYPKWIPGEHAPSGPIEDLAGVRITANGKPIPWHRDDVDIYEFHIDVPQDVSTLDVALDFISPPETAGFTSGASTTTHLAVLSWNQLVLYPKGIPADRLQYKATLKVPAGWSYATALPIDRESGNEISFKASSLTTLIDSPVQTGANFKTVDLSPGDPVRHYLHIAAESERATHITDDEIKHYRNLVDETNELFGARHYRDYHFLLTLSDNVAHFGLEHHESSDDREAEDALIDDEMRKVDADLLAHEYVHSWNGKFRRPAGLATPDYSAPMKGDLLWVYEGLTEYLGKILTPRSGLWTEQEFLDAVARDAAALDHENGRTWRPLADTAVSAQALYNSREDYADFRRGTDFYEEGTLIWLDVDVTLRTLTKGKKSIEDFCKTFEGAPNTGPAVEPYTFDDLVRALNSVHAYDWASFLNQRIESTSPHAPLDGISNGGYKLVYTEERSDLWKAREFTRRVIDLSYSLGMTVRDSGDIVDVHLNTPAFKAGVAPATRIIAVNGRQFSNSGLHHAVEDAAKSTALITLLIRDGEYYKTLSLDYHDGEKYPHLVRDKSKPDLISEIIRPRTSASRKPSPGGPK